ncbi:MAG: ArsB/NhaD family transporter [Candidatus Thermoplasmatota archaeon]|nr:ArsB/NhaD family transporter [Candidatus Thermoplasmatota archaeon]
MINLGTDMRVLAIIIFVATYGLIMSNKIHRTIAALLGAVALYVFGVLPDGMKIFTDIIDWDALGLMFGMFIMVGALRESGFFRWIGINTLRAAKFDIIKIFLLFSALTTLLSAFMGSITVMLFMASLTLDVCAMMGINPIPFIISEICCSNIGGSATMMGDPPNIIIGAGCNLTFGDFLTNTAIIAVIAFAADIIFFYFWYRKELKGSAKKDTKELEKMKASEAITDKRLMIAGICSFVLTIILLTVYQQIGLSVGFVGIIGALFVLVAGGSKMPEVIEKVDWLTLIFFAGLFIVIGGLEETGVITIAASYISQMKGGLLAISMVILWLSAYVSAFVDNVPLAATMVPMIKMIAGGNAAHLDTLAWSLAIGTDIGGNATPIGASANVVGLAIAEKSGYRVSWGYYCKVGFISMTIAIAVSALIIWLRYFVFA